MEGWGQYNQLILKLGLPKPKPKPKPYNMRMANQTTTKSMGLNHDLKIYIHDIPYVITFTEQRDRRQLFHTTRETMVEGCQSSPCQGKNIVTIQWNGMVRTIVMTKHLGAKVK